MHKDIEILTIAQIPEYLQVNEVTIYKYVKEGTLPAFKIARQWRIKREDLYQFIEHQKSAKFMNKR
ncbi:helix-turn-helix domain-containing protein [Gracilibacillus sp. YIM 98692]|uniref:helix-turn-helix domain-containing protein n=1 Tax=Gracilibacillus sp. YIM 98692 TaxID=2663532 RepID=UPI0013D8CFD2|nr:helix-turn-helix domain-containing protein [Gracilibacillus sp. YIM 98692]